MNREKIIKKALYKLNSNKFWKTINWKLAGAYDPNEDYSGKYMTAFYFEDDKGIPYCHCTHKYLGEMDPKKLPEIIKIIDEYMQDVPKKERTWVFDKYEVFGEEKDTPVMRRKETKDMLLGLKEDLDKIIEDKWKTYKPHITLGQKIEDLSEEKKKTPLVMKPTCLALVEGDKKLKEWSLVKN